MNSGWRAVFGAALGALIVLFVHPSSRQFVETALTHWGTSQAFNRTDYVLQNHPVLPEPAGFLGTDRWMVGSSLWVEAGAQKLALREPIGKDNFDKLIYVAGRSAQLDPDNAYWRQMQAVFLNAESRLPNLSENDRMRLDHLAMQEWTRAGSLARWDDYQTIRLKAVEEQLATESGGVAAWEYAVAYPMRSTDAARAIAAYTREILRDLPITGREALLKRYGVLMNGKLMRDGARSIEIGEMGASMVETASYSQDMSFHATPKKLVLSRTGFYNRLVKGGLPQEAVNVNQAFLSNDGWLAFTHQDDLLQINQELRIGSILTITLPGTFIAIALFGGLLWAFSLLLRAKPVLLKLVEPPYAPVLGLILSVLLYRATGLPLASIAVVACFGFLAFTPVHERSHPPEQLGPVFELTLFALGCVLGVLLAAFLVGLSTPACEILREMNVPVEYFGGSTLLLGLSGIVLGLLLLAAPCWAMVQRISTPSVVVLTLRQFGRGLFLGCLGLAILVTPICILGDKYIGTKLDEIVSNEPLVYLNQ